jgi:uncharacterized membrane protein
MAIARENETFPEYMPDIKSVKVLSRSEDTNTVVSEWVGEVPKFHNKVRWTEEDVWDKQKGTCTYRQIGGDYDVFEGVWTFTTIEGGQTRFDAWLNYEITIPVVGILMKQIIHKTMVENLKSTMYAIRRRCEQG